MSKYEVDTYDYGKQYVWAKTPQAAVSRIVYRIFGRGYTGYDHEYWTVTLKDSK